jgi:hypothetical protein
LTLTASLRDSPVPASLRALGGKDGIIVATVARPTRVPLWIQTVTPQSTQDASQGFTAGYGTRLEAIAFADAQHGWVSDDLEDDGQSVCMGDATHGWIGSGSTVWRLSGV